MVLLLHFLLALLLLPLFCFDIICWGRRTWRIPNILPHLLPLSIRTLARHCLCCFSCRETPSICVPMHNTTISRDDRLQQLQASFPPVTSNVGDLPETILCYSHLDHKVPSDNPSSSNYCRGILHLAVSDKIGPSLSPLKSLFVPVYSFCRQRYFAAMLLPANCFASSSIGNNISYNAFDLLVRIFGQILRLFKPSIIVSRLTRWSAGIPFFSRPLLPQDCF